VPALTPLGTGLDEGAQARAARILALAASKWALPVLEAMGRGTVRFNALRRTVDGISHRLLTVTLRRLTEEGLVERVEFDESVLHVEYHLTEAGRALVSTIYGFCAWTARHPADRPMGG
jgi:DNA-binding HxlR family transcriptional regulator